MPNSLETRMSFDLSPNLAHNARPSVAGKGRAVTRVIPQNRLPQANATGLQGLGEGQLTQNLPPYHGIYQPFVRRHQMVQACMPKSAQVTARIAAIRLVDARPEDSP
jgi:hypothetical protein